MQRTYSKRRLYPDRSRPISSPQLIYIPLSLSQPPEKGLLWGFLQCAFEICLKSGSQALEPFLMADNSPYLLTSSNSFDTDNSTRDFVLHMGDRRARGCVTNENPGLDRTIAPSKGHRATISRHHRHLTATQTTIRNAPGLIDKVQFLQSSSESRSHMYTVGEVQDLRLVLQPPYLIPNASEAEDEYHCSPRLKLENVRIPLSVFIHRRWSLEGQTIRSGR
jgi:hypothetical protein